MAMHVVLVEDDPKIGSFVAQGMKQDGHAVDWARTGPEGLALAGKDGVDVAIVDLMLPGRDGLSIVRELRSRNQRVPIIILSARSDVGDRVRGLEAGADDYLTKPFSFVELRARVAAITRRAGSGAPSEPTQVAVGDLVLDRIARRARRGDVTIELHAKEFLLLEYLMRNAGRVLSKTMILEQVWGYGFDPQTNVVDVLVSRLRAKIDRDFPRKLIHTVRGVGYVVRDE